MQRVFISYSRQDERFARRLATALDAAGADIWIDVDDIPAGANWSNAIQEGLDTADALLLVVSPDAMASENVTDEWQYALDHQRPVIPLRWKPTKMHFQLHRKQYIDFHEQSFDKAIADLIAELSRQGVPLDEAPSEPTLMPLLEPVDTRAQVRRYVRLGIVMIAALLVFFVISQLDTGRNAEPSALLANLPPALLYDGPTSIQLHSAIGGASPMLDAATDNARITQRIFHEDGQFWYQVEPLDGTGDTGYQIGSNIPLIEPLLRIVPVGQAIAPEQIRLYTGPSFDAASATWPLSADDRIATYGYTLDETDSEWQFVAVTTSDGDYLGWQPAPSDTSVANTLPVIATTVSAAPLYGRDPSTSDNRTILRTLSEDSRVPLLRRTVGPQATWYLVAAHSLDEGWALFWTSAEHFDLNPATRASLPNG